VERRGIMERAIEVILVVLEFLAGRLGFALVPVEDAEGIFEAGIPYRLRGEGS
jgi:hypothetical protein